MNIVFTILVAFATGYFVKQRGLAVVTYLALDAILFSYQSVGVLLDWLSDNQPVAFGPAPTAFPISYSNSEYLGYGIVNLVVTAAGVGLTILGNHVAKRRAAKRTTIAVGGPTG